MLKCAEFGIVFDSCITERGYWQNHVNFILVHLERGANYGHDIEFNVKYAKSPLNPSLITLMTACSF